MVLYNSLNRQLISNSYPFSSVYTFAKMLKTLISNSYPFLSVYTFAKMLKTLQ